MPSRLALAVVSVGLLASGLAAAPSSAAAARPAPKCPMVSDPRHDYQGSLPDAVGAASYDPTLDILEANVWADTRMLHAYIRLAQLPSAEEPRTLYGHQWTVRLDTPEGYPLYVSLITRDEYDEPFAYTENRGTAYYVSYLDVTAQYVRNRNAIRINVPLSEIANDVRATPGTRWKFVGAYAFQLHGNPTVKGPPFWLGPGGAGEQVDSAPTERAVVVGKPECRA